MADEVDVVVAAVAFGTGVDKANVRFVSTAIRATPSTRSTQKVRRAGRDGEPAEATLFFRAEDLGLRRFVAGSGRVGKREIAAIAEAVSRALGGVSIEELRERSGLSQANAQSAVNRLEDEGRSSPQPSAAIRAPRSTPPFAPMSGARRSRRRGSR
jgi:ATP-dependent DNA helicase RecQ